MQDEEDDIPHGASGDDLGLGIMAAFGTLAAFLSILVMAFVNQLGGAKPGEATAPPASEAAFEAPAPVIATVAADFADAAWLQNAQAFDAAPETPLIAVIVLDDGTASHAAARALEWRAPLTFAIATDFEDSRQRLRAIRHADREAMAILPMGYGPDFDRDPNVLRRDLSETELLRRTRWHLARAEGTVGVIDRHGGDILRDIVALRVIGQGLAEGGFAFVDSRTAKGSLAAPRLRASGIPAARRTALVSATDDPEAVRAALTDAERRASLWGTAIVVVEPGSAPMSILADWLRSRDDTIAIAPVSHVIRRLRTGQ